MWAASMSAAAIAGLHGRLVRAEIDAEDARHRLDREVVRRPAAVGPGLAVGRDRDVDDPRIARADRRVADAEAMGHAGAEGFDEDVRARGQAQQRFDPFRALEVEHEAALAALRVGEEHRDAIALQADLAARLAARRLDLDHLGAMVGHRLGQRRPGQKQRQIDDPYAFELHPATRRAQITRAARSAAISAAS